MKLYTEKSRCADPCGKEIDKFMNEYKYLKILCKYLVSKKESIVVSGTKYVVGAIALDHKGNIISKGCNSFVKTHPFQKKIAESVGKPHKIYLHAEISALVQAHSKIDTLIIARIRQSDNSIAISKPCPVCSEAIRQAHIKKVYFTNDLGELILLKI